MERKIKIAQEKVSHEALVALQKVVATAVIDSEKAATSATLRIVDELKKLESLDPQVQAVVTALLNNDNFLKEVQGPVGGVGPAGVPGQVTNVAFATGLGPGHDEDKGLLDS